MDDEDPAALAAGVEQLARWFETPEQLEATLQGVQLTGDLEEGVVNALDGADRNATGLMGMSFALKSPHGVEKLAKTLVWSGYGDVLDHLPLYERTFEPEGADTSCFYDRTCAQMTAHVRIQADWSILGVIESQETLQYRWVETLAGWTLLERAWLEAPVHVSSLFGDVALDDIYTLVVHLPNEGIEGVELAPGVVETAAGLQGGAVGGFDTLYRALCSPGTLRVEARWMRASFPMTDEQAVDQTMNSAKTDATKVDEWISANYDLVTPGEEERGGDEQEPAPAGFCDDETGD